MILPTEPIGSIPRPQSLIDKVHAFEQGKLSAEALDQACADAVRDTIRAFEATGSPIITDGEQRKIDSFWTYGIRGLDILAPGGFEIPFKAGHIRRMPLLVRKPFRYRIYADSFVQEARRLTRLPIKQAVISPSALSLLYPVGDIPGYSRQDFIADLLDEHVAEIRRCFVAGATSVQVDFTEARLALLLDPTGQLLASFIELNNMALDRFTADERQRIGFHTCPGGDRDSTHSAQVDYAALLPSLFKLKARSLFVQLASEPDRIRVLRLLKESIRPDQMVYVGVIDPLDPRVETAEDVCMRVLEAARFIPLSQLGTTDDCGFAPFCDDTSTSRDTAFAKIRARVQGTAMAWKKLT